MFQSPEYEVLDLGLILYKNIIPEPEKIIDIVNSVDARYSNKEHGDVYTSVRAWEPWSYGPEKFCEKKYVPILKHIPDTDPYAKEQIEISKTLYSSLDRAFDHYSNVLYPFANKNIKGREESMGLLRYESDGFLPAHQDQGISSRVLSAVSYLNSDYDGGEIEFINSGVKIKPPAGSIIFFPSNFLYVHEVHKMNSGVRYALPYWFHNREIIIESNGSE